MTKSTWLHLRIPFSFFLLPVFLFALCSAPEVKWPNAISMFFILHFFLYPASNGYNSYFDKDQDSIGGLKNPPPVSRDLYFVSLVLDVIAVIWGLLIDWQIALMLIIYGLASKAYSHPGIRLKKYPVLGWLIAGLFQGAFTLLMVVKAVAPEGDSASNYHTLIAAGLSTVLLWGSFPMTQVYQHHEDARRGDLTISRWLGIRGTFIFSSACFLVANLLFIWFLATYYSVGLAWGFQAAMLPIFGYFLNWCVQVWKDPTKANFVHTMRLNLISSLLLNLFFGVWLWLG